MLSFNEIVETINELVKNDSGYYRMFEADVTLVKGMEEISQQYSAEIASGRVKMSEDKSMYQHSGLFVRDIYRFNDTLSASQGALKQILKDFAPPLSGEYTFLTFETKEELVDLLNAINQRVSNYMISPQAYKEHTIVEKLQQGSKDENVNNELAELFKTQYSLEEKCALVMYKSRMYAIMNYIWEKFKNVKDIDFRQINEELDNDKSIFTMTVKDIFKFFKKAKENSANDEFFSKYLKDINMTDEKAFVGSIIKQMAIIEKLGDKIVAPSTLTLFRGVCGTASPDVMAKSRMISTTPDYKTARNFARGVDAAGLISMTDNTLFRIQIEQGSPIIPLLFSVKTSIQGIAGDEFGEAVDYSTLPPDAITLDVETSQDVQLEILLDNNFCKINMQQQGAEKQTLHSNKPNFDIPLIIKFDPFAPIVDTYDLNRVNIGRRAYAVGFGIKNNYSATFYPQVSVQTKEQIHTVGQ